jgi:hypothetical protein
MAKEQQRLDLIHVVWGEDQGIVSLEQNKWLFYTWGRFSGYHANDGIPTVGVEDVDFRLLGDDPDDRTCRQEHSNWDCVVGLLRHKRFPLAKRIRENCLCRRNPGIMVRTGRRLVCPTCGRALGCKEQANGQS